MSGEVPRSYMISPRSPQRAPEMTQIIHEIARRFPGTRIVRISDKESLAVLVIPDEMLPGVKNALADGYFVEPNYSLGY